MENTLLAIRAGKAVLCEKPVSMNARQLQRMITAAKKQKVFLMEAMWTRFFPAVEQVRKWLADKRIGRVLALEADFGIHFKVGPSHRIFNPELGGGALLDLGIYIVSMASMIYGSQPKKITSSVHFSKSGVDDQSTLLFEYEQGATAVLMSSAQVHIRPEVRIYGTEGQIYIHELFICPSRVTLQVVGENPETLSFPYPGHGMQYEADHVAEYLQKDKLQSDIMPPDESLAIMRTLDKIRRQWKLTYPNE